MSRDVQARRRAVLGFALMGVMSAALWAGHRTMVLADPTTAPATSPSTKPTADKGADETVPVAKGSIDTRIDLDAVFVPVDAFEAKVATKFYQGDLVITQIAQPGDAVKKGDVLLASNRADAAADRPG